MRLDTPDDVADWAAHRAAQTVVLAALSVPEGTLLVALDDGTMLHDRPVVVLSAPSRPMHAERELRVREQEVAVIFTVYCCHLDVTCAEVISMLFIY